MGAFRRAPGGFSGPAAAAAARVVPECVVPQPAAVGCPCSLLSPCCCCKNRYKAYFRWPHYCHKLKNDTSILPTETDACPSVTAAFLQVGYTSSSSSRPSTASEASAAATCMLSAAAPPSRGRMCRGMHAAEMRCGFTLLTPECQHVAHHSGLLAAALPAPLCARRSCTP